MTTPTLRDSETASLSNEALAIRVERIAYILENGGTIDTTRVLQALYDCRLALTAPEQSPADGGQLRRGLESLALEIDCEEVCGHTVAASIRDLLATPAAPTSWEPVAWADPRDLEDATDTFIVASCEKRQIPGGDKLRFKVPLYAPPSAAQADGARKALEAAGRLLMTAHRAAIKLGLRDRGSDCSLSHEVRMFALAFSEEGRDGPGELQTRGTGEYRATRKLIEAALTAAPEKLEGQVAQCGTEANPCERDDCWLHEKCMAAPAPHQQAAQPAHTRDFPAVKEAGRAAASQLGFYKRMMEPQQAAQPEKLAPAPQQAGQAMDPEILQAVIVNSWNRPQQAAQGGERERFAQAMVEAGYHHPERGPFNDSQFKFERDEDRFVGWQLARAAQGGREGLTEGWNLGMLSMLMDAVRRNGSDQTNAEILAEIGITTPAGDSE